MKINLQTTMLKNLTARVSKGASNLNDRLITATVSLKVKDKDLTMITTSLNHTVKVWAKDVVKESTSFNCSLNAELLTKLTKLTTVDNITLTEEKDKIIFQGNGIYTLAQLLDVDGSFAEVPELDYNEDDLLFTVKVPTSKLKKALLYNKISVGLNVDVATYGSAYFLDNDAIITFDQVTSVFNKDKAFDTDHKLLINSTVMDLMDLIESENTEIKVYKQVVKFIGDDIEITSIINDRVDLFPHTNLRQTLNNGYDYHIVVKRTEILNALDRLSLFLNVGEKNQIKLMFDSNKLLLSSKSAAGNEILYSDNFKDMGKVYSEAVDLMDLKRHITPHQSELIYLKYGGPAGLLIEQDNVMHLIPYYDSDESEEELDFDSDFSDEITDVEQADAELLSNLMGE